MELGYELINEANKELSLFQSKLSNYYWGYTAKERRERHWMGAAYARFKCTLMCSLIAHSRGTVHLSGCSLEEQEHFLEANKDEWEYLVHRIPKNRPDIIDEETTKVLDSITQNRLPKKTFLDKLKALI